MNISIGIHVSLQCFIHHIFTWTPYLPCWHKTLFYFGIARYSRTMWQVEQSLTCKEIRRRDDKNKDSTMQQLLYGEIFNKDFLRCFFLLAGGCAASQSGATFENPSWLTRILTWKFRSNPVPAAEKTQIWKCYTILLCPQFPWIMFSQKIPPTLDRCQTQTNRNLSKSWQLKS